MKYKVITDNAARLLHHLTEGKKQFFTFDDVMGFMTETSKPYAKKLLKDLVERELILRLRKGLYVTVPYEAAAKDYFPDLRIVAAHLAGDAKYYISYYSALQLHSLTTQPSYVTQIVVNKRIFPTIQKIHDTEFQFIYQEEKFFFGMKKMWPDGYNWVNCSDLEKTIIDCLYKPDYAMGITEVAKALYQAKEKLNYEKLLNYLKQFKKQVAIKRLGFLLELLEIKTPIIDELLKLRTPFYVALDPSHPKTGKTANRWYVQENYDLETIKQAPHS